MITTTTQRSQVVHCFERIEAWPHWHEIQLGAQKEYRLTTEAFHALLPEYQRFLALAGVYPGIGMFSESIDQLWHAHILNTLRYQEFCTDVLGRFVHHLPCSSFELYGIVGEICKEPPATCTDPWPAPPDPSPVPKEVPSHAAIRESIRQGAQRFINAYTETYGVTPSHAIYTRLREIPDGIAP